MHCGSIMDSLPCFSRSLRLSRIDNKEEFPWLNLNPLRARQNFLADTRGEQTVRALAL